MFKKEGEYLFYLEFWKTWSKNATRLLINTHDSNNKVATIISIKHLIYATQHMENFSYMISFNS